MRKAALIVLLTTLGGCASAFTAVTDRSITSDRLDQPHDQNKINGYSGDRRLVYIRKGMSSAGPDGQAATERWLICRESFAGALASRSAASSLSIATHESGSDATTEALTKVDERAAAVRLYEDASADLCYMRSAGVINDADYWARAKTIQDAAFVALQTPPAKTTPPAADATATAVTAAAAKKAKLDACNTDAGTDDKKKAACTVVYGS